MVAMTCGSFRHVIEHELGKLPCFVIYALLEWVLIGILLLEGFLAFFAHEFARLFELETPCTLCTRIDHVFIHRNTLLYYNECVCNVHKSQISTLGYCHAHKKLVDIRTMCEVCHHHGIEDTDRISSLWNHQNDENSKVCSCCGDSMLTAANKSSRQLQNISIPHGIAVAPAPSPTGPWKNEKTPTTGLDFSHLKRSQNKLSMFEEGGIGNVPIIQAADEEQIKDSPSMKANKILFSSEHSAAGSPRFANRTPKKSMLDRMELGSADPFDNIGTSEPEDSIINRLKMQLKMDRKSLASLQMELDQERNAAAEAANNAMAMITRLQTEKAALQMEALQYKRMMDEQSEYDQEALLSLKDLLDKREDEMRDVEVELEIYRERYGALTEGIRRHRLERSQSFASFNDRFDKPIPEFFGYDHQMIKRNHGDFDDDVLHELCNIGSDDEENSKNGDNVDKTDS